MLMRQSKWSIQISIHALPAEGDVDYQWSQQITHISIHALPAEGDGTSRRKTWDSLGFQSTPSPRRATFGSLPDAGR